MKQFIILLLNVLSVGLANIVSLFNPLVKKLLQLWRLTQVRSRVMNAIPNSTQLDGYVHIIGTGNIKFGEHCRVGHNVILETRGNGSITIGSNVRINQGSVLVAYDDMEIGNDCLIGEYCSIRDANHGIDKGALIRTQPHTYKTILIEDDCWVGRGAVILRGVTLRKGCVIGANSVVTKNIDEQVISVGVPSKGRSKRLG